MFGESLAASVSLHVNDIIRVAHRPEGPLSAQTNTFHVKGQQTTLTETDPLVQSLCRRNKSPNPADLLSCCAQDISTLVLEAGHAGMLSHCRAN